MEFRLGELTLVCTEKRTEDCTSLNTSIYLRGRYSSTMRLKSKGLLNYLCERKGEIEGERENKERCNKEVVRSGLNY